MLFAHGFGCDQNMWRYVYPAFEEQYKIILFDYVGSGKSDLSAYNAERYADLNFGPRRWRQMLRRVARRLDRKYTFSVANSRGLSNDAVIAAAIANYDPRTDLGRPDAYRWTVTRTGQGANQRAVATFDLTIYHLDIDISERGGGHVHADEDSDLYYGESTYAPPPPP